MRRVCVRAKRRTMMRISLLDVGSREGHRLRTTEACHPAPWPLLGANRARPNVVRSINFGIGRAMPAQFGPWDVRVRVCVGFRCIARARQLPRGRNNGCLLVAVSSASSGCCPPGACARCGSGASRLVALEILIGWRPNHDTLPMHPTNFSKTIWTGRARVSGTARCRKARST